MQLSKSKKLVYGIGINDADYAVHKFENLGRVDGKKKVKRIWSCPFYMRWVNVLERCNPTVQQTKKKTYAGVTICEEWKYFSKFKAWMEQQNWQGMDLDKDIVVFGNKIYSPETCRFVPHYLNKLLTLSDANRGDWPLGVSLRKDSNVFVSVIKTRTKKTGGKIDYLGQYNNPLDAHKAWQKEKMIRIQDYIEAYKAGGDYLDDVVAGLVYRINLIQYQIDNDIETTFL